MLGALATAGPAVAAVGKALDSLFTSDEERLTKQEALEKLRQKPAEMQAAINLAEAKHRSVFVAGWRPAIGWVCAAGLAYEFLVRPLLGYALAIFAPDIPPPVDLTNSQELMALVMALLGLGGMRTYEKHKGRTR